jgi:surface antigen/nucleoid-associated protein YgaU
MPGDFSGNSPNSTQHAANPLNIDSHQSISTALLNSLNTKNNFYGSSSSILESKNIATASTFIDNSSSNFIGDPNKPWDDAFIYAAGGVIFNGNPTLSSLPGALTVGVNGTVSSSALVASNLQFSRLTQPLVIETPAYEGLQNQALAQFSSKPDSVFNYSQPLNTPADVASVFPSSDNGSSVVRIVNSGLNLPAGSRLHNLVITVENGDINFNGDTQELSHVTLIAKNGNVNLSGVQATDVSVFASGSINMNNAARFSGNNLLATKDGSVIFNGSTTTTNPSDSVLVVTNGNIIFNAAADTRANFLASGSFTANSTSKIIGSIRTQGDIIFNAPVQVIADNVIDPNQPAILLIDGGVAANNPYLNYRRLVSVEDYVDNDNNAFLSRGEDSEHGTHLAGIIDSINNKAPIYVARAIGSGKWEQALIDSIDAAKQSGQSNIVVNLALDLTQVNNADGTVTTRYEFTPDERIALEYAHQQGVVIVTAAGNDGGVMSVLGQSSQEFDNIITVGAANGLLKADYSSYGHGLNILAPGGTTENPILSTVGDGVGTMAGTSVATSYVIGAASRVWAENPNLSYRQVIEILESSATDLEATGWDIQTGSGLLNQEKAIELAKVTIPQSYKIAPVEAVNVWSGEGKVTQGERAVSQEYTIKANDTLWDIATVQLGNPYRWSEITKADGSTFTSEEARRIQPGNIVYLPLSSGNNTNTNNTSTYSTPGARTQYVIKPGDTLWAIAATQLGNPYRWSEITKADGSTFTSVEARRIQTGNIVYLPLNTNGASKGGYSNTPAENVATTGYRGYYVRSDDTPSGIALRELGNANRWREILKKDNNVLSDWDTRNLQTGQLLWLPIGYQSGIGKSVIPSFPSPNPSGVSRSTIGIPINLNSSFYTNDNLFWKSGYGGPNCTWYANGRLKELGYRASALDKMLGNAHQWDDQARKAGIPVTNKAQVGAIAVWEPNHGGAGRLGHVAVVEQINPDGSLLISESNWLGKMYNTRTISGNKLPDHFVIVPRNSVSGNTGSSPSINVQPVNSIIFFPQLPTLSPATINMSSNESNIYSRRHDIKKAANEFGVSAELLGSIILDELNRRDFQDDTQDFIAQYNPMLVYEQDWSIGIAQMKPKTALTIFENYLGFCPTPESLIKSLLNDSQACRLVAAWIVNTIKEWSVKDPSISKQYDILATLYSRGYSAGEIKSNPQPNDRGTAIANNMQRINNIVNYDPYVYFSNYYN